jgi:hypothetical protein
MSIRFAIGPVGALISVIYLETAASAEPQRCVLTEDNAPKSFVEELCGIVMEQGTEAALGGEGLPQILVGKIVGTVSCSYVGGKLWAIFEPKPQYPNLCDFSVLDRMHNFAAPCRRPMFTTPRTALEKEMADTISLLPPCKK